MKKNIFFGVVFILALGFSACKKDYTCTCTMAGISVSSTLHTTKKKAKDACTAGSSTVGGITTTCKID